MEAENTPVVEGEIKSSRRADHIKQKRQQRLVILLVILVILCGVYGGGVWYFTGHFLPNTSINGVDCSYKTAAQVDSAFVEKADTYVLTLIEREDGQETISGTAIALTVDLGDYPQEYLTRQNPWLWVFAFAGETVLEPEAAIDYDAAALATVVSQLSCMDEDIIYDSEDATLSDYVEGVGFSLVDEVYGTRLDEEVFWTSQAESISSLADELDLSADGCYVVPVYTADSVEAKSMLAVANAYTQVTITYTFGSNTEVLDGEKISQWIVVGEDLEVSLDENLAAEYIQDLANTYDTKWKSRTLVSHSGTTVTVPAGGNYGWRVNQDDTLSALLAYLQEGEDYTGEVVYYQTAAQYGDQDYGTTYVEVSISAQHFWYYVDGVVVLESDFVSGDVDGGHDTPKGAYRIAYKARDQVLEGQGYSSPVSYWMPFVDGCGFHDASWRDSFGGSIYLTNGSHGCINLPTSVAESLYNLIEAGTAVLIY